MPKANATIVPVKAVTNSVTKQASKSSNTRSSDSTEREVLEVDPSKHTMPDIGNIIQDKTVVPPLSVKDKVIAKERENSPDFVDDLDVPPLM